MRKILFVVILALSNHTFASGDVTEGDRAINPFFEITTQCRNQLKLLEVDDNADMPETIGIEHSLIELDNMIRGAHNPSWGLEDRGASISFSYMHHALVQWDLDQLKRRSPIEAANVQRHCDLLFLKTRFEYSMEIINEVVFGIPNDSEQDSLNIDVPAEKANQSAGRRLKSVQ